ncbi:hypothetical protein FGB62_57g22 [Gracilaria domingensis]|nr:hypothetical protein FGB62_57g22 [Gracilaria domingensis]
MSAAFVPHTPTLTRVKCTPPFLRCRLPRRVARAPRRQRPLFTAQQNPVPPKDEVAPQLAFSTAASSAPTLSSALTEAASRALSKLGPGGPPHVAFVFVLVRYSLSNIGPSGRDSLDLVVPRLRALVPELKAGLGCTSDGVIGSSPLSDVVELQDVPSVSITLARLPKMKITSFHVMPDDLPNPDARQSEWRRLVSNPDDTNHPPAFIVLSDPSFAERGELDTFLSGVEFAYPGSCVVGSLASAAAAFAQGHMFCTLPTDVLSPHSSSLRDSGLVGIALTGDIEVDCLVSSGYRSIGPTYEVRKVSNGIVREMELVGRSSTLMSAMSHLKSIISYATPQEKVLMQDQLHVGIAIESVANSDSDSEAYLIRHVRGVDMDGGGISVAHNIGPGQRIRFVLQEAEAAEKALDANLQRYKRAELANSLVGYSNPPFGAMVFVDNGRGRALFREPRMETKNLTEFATGVPITGCFAGGQIGPCKSGAGNKNMPSVVHHVANLIAFVRRRSGISPAKPVDSPSTSGADLDETPEK